MKATSKASIITVLTLVFSLFYATAAEVDRVLPSSATSVVAGESALVVQPETKAEPAKVSATITSKALSGYVFPETGESLHDKPVLQSELVVEFPLGIYIILWHSMGFDSDLSGDYGDEVDYMLGWAGDVGPLTLDVGFGYYDSADILFQGLEDDTFHLYTEVSKTFETKFGEVTPFLKGDFFFQSPGSDTEGGVIASVGMRYDPASVLEVEWLSIPINLQLSHDDGAYGADRGLFARFEVEAAWKVWKGVEILFPSVSVYKPLTVDDRETECVYGGGVSVKF